MYSPLILIILECKNNFSLINEYTYITTTCKYRILIWIMFILPLVLISIFSRCLSFRLILDKKQQYYQTKSNLIYYYYWNFFIYNSAIIYVKISWILMHLNVVEIKYNELLFIKKEFYTKHIFPTMIDVFIIP